MRWPSSPTAASGPLSATASACTAGCPRLASVPTEHAGVPGFAAETWGEEATLPQPAALCPRGWRDLGRAIETSPGSVWAFRGPISVWWGAVRQGEVWSGRARCGPAGRGAVRQGEVRFRYGEEPVPAWCAAYTLPVSQIGER